MASQGFSFPPPPPPPPTAQQPAYPPAQHGQNWGRGGGQRGRGRGQGNRGRGGNHNDSGRAPSYPQPTGYNYPQTNYGGYPTQPVPTAPYMPPSPYAHGQSQGYQNPQTAPAYQNTQYPQQVASHPHHPNNPPANHAAPYPQPPIYMQGLPAPPHGLQPNNKPMMGTMPWGNDMQGQYMGGQGQARGPRPHVHGNSGQKPKMNHKRDHSSAFTKPQSTVPRTPAAPAVPSFGNPLPVKPPPAVDATSNRKAKKRKRKHNQLGLTPQADDHESSEEEGAGDDEESKLAQGASGTAPLQISYKGKTSTLQTQAEIAAWIAERKKKFPTQARVDAKKEAADEAKATREAARQQKIEEQQAKRKDTRKQSEAVITNPPDVGADAQRREELRRNLEREQKRIAKAVAEADAARLRLEALQKEALSLNPESEHEDAPVINVEPIDQDPQAPTPEIKPEAAINVEPAVNIEPHDSIPESEPGVPASPVKEVYSESILGSKPETPIQHPTQYGTDGQTDLTNQGSDWTSSGGSDSESGSDSDSDSAPEQESSRRTGPERVPPPPREGKKTICRYFARTGQCNRGDQCKFIHESSEAKARPERKENKEKETRRKGLFQALLDRQKEDEDRRAMEVISYLGQNNLL